MHSRADNPQINVSVTKKIGEIYMSSKITYMVRPISVYTEFLQTEILDISAQGVSHWTLSQQIPVQCQVRDQPGARDLWLRDVWPSL